MSGLLNSGTTITLARPAILPSSVKSEETLAVLCIHGDAHSIPTAQVKIQSQAGKWPLFIGIALALEVLGFLLY